MIAKIDGKLYLHPQWGLKKLKLLYYISRAFATDRTKIPKNQIPISPLHAASSRYDSFPPKISRALPTV